MPGLGKIGLGLTVSGRGPGGSGVSIIDTFTRADSAVTMGSTEAPNIVPWVVLAGTAWGISTNRATRVTPSGGAFDSVVVDNGMSNVAVQATDVSTVLGQGLTFRRSDVNNGFVVELNATSRRVYRLQAGSYTQIAIDAVTPAANDVVKVTATGSTLVLFVNAAQTGTATDAFNATATKHGYQSTTNTAGIIFDTFSIVAN